MHNFFLLRKLLYKALWTNTPRTSTTHPEEDLFFEQDQKAQYAAGPQFEVDGESPRLKTKRVLFPFAQEAALVHRVVAKRIRKLATRPIPARNKISFIPRIGASQVEHSSIFSL